MDSTKLNNADHKIACDRQDSHANEPHLLLHGLDSLYVCYYLDLVTSNLDFEDLEYRKQLVKDGQRDQGLLELGSEHFFLRAYGQKPYRYVLENEAFSLAFGENMSPSLKVQFYSAALWRDGAMALHSLILTWAKSIGAHHLRPEVVSRADWAFDFDLPIVDFNEDHFASRARKDAKYRESGQPQTFVFGSVQIVVRVYDKVAEIEQASGKAWFYDLWGQKAIVYARVSTTRQADHDLSIPDQLAHAERYCTERDIEVVVRYVDKGASARDDNRPEFQRMIAAVKSGEAQADLIVVHSFSRFFREALGSAYYSRILGKHGLKVVSITQETGEGPQGDLMRQILSSFDEYQSAETAKHVTRSMLENARRGYWNGSLPPFGYKTIVAVRLGNKDKKKLATEVKEAELVKLMFRLYLHGNGKSGPMGVKNVVSYLNARGFTHRKGRPFRIQTVHGILIRTAYIGTHYFNRRDSRAQKPRPREEWIPIEVPRIVEDDIFHAVQEQLKARHSSITHPRITNSQILLTGIASCDYCGAPMRIRTGKSGKYRYYTCSKKADSGRTACKGVSIPMPKLDDALCDRIMQPERLKKIIGALVARNSGRRDALQRELRELRGQRRDIAKQIQNLVDVIEAGDAAQLRALSARLTKRQTQDDELIRLTAYKERELNQPIAEVTSKRVEVVSKALRTALNGDSNPQLRRAYIRHFLSEVSVSEKSILISGPKAALTHQLTAVKPLPPSMVPSTVQEWRTRQDSNL